LLRDQATARARAELRLTMTSTAQILRKTRVPDSSGGSVDVYASVGTYPCTYAHYPIRPREAEEQPRIMAISEWFFNFPVGTLILSTDRVLVDSRSFEVVDAGESPYELCSKATCLEIE